MKIDLSAPTPLQYFSALVEADGELPLLEAAASVAQDEYPGLDLQQVLHEVDQLAARLRRKVPRNASALTRLHVLGRFFFGELGFGGNVNDYYDPDNSFLHVVLERRRGIPISLAVLWLELARGIDLPVEGVNFPTHFLVQAHVGRGRVVVDPFTGQSLSPEELRARLEQLSLPQPYQRGQDFPLLPYLNAASPRKILARLLGNLQAIYRSREDWERLLAVQDRLVTLLPRAWSEYRNRGLALAELGERERARADLALYLRRVTHAADREAISRVLDQLGG